ncbi:MAG: T9SS type A sorting domain-containing protein [Ignavibacteria bacterium]|nr:T9SS type A sorting domain-containing protein [Ignavibacteria bacterium]
MRIVWPNGNLSPAGYVSVREVSGSCTLTDSIAVELKLYAYPIIDVLGPDQFCEGDSVILDAGGLWDSYRWSTGDTTRFIVVKRTGVYTRFSPAGGTAAASFPRGEITVFPEPAAPVISRTGDVLHCGTQAAAYQWQRMGVPIPGATSRDHSLTMTGVYFVSITDTNGCTNTSAPFTVLSLPVEKLPPDDVGFEWYPQPVRGDFTVRFGDGYAGSTRISIMDILGRTVFSETVDIEDRGIMLIPFERPLPGVYFLTVQSGTRRLSLPFLKVK